MSNDIYKAILDNKVEDLNLEKNMKEGYTGVPNAPSAPVKILGDDQPPEEQMTSSAPPSQAQMTGAAAKSQGRYDTTLDDFIAANADENMVLLPGPSMNYSPLSETHNCGGCGTTYAKAVTVCPECQLDKSSSQYLQATGGVQMDDDVKKSLRPTTPAPGSHVAG
jgi:hypothetical protein